MGEAMPLWIQGVYKKISILFSQFCCEPKGTIKKMKSQEENYGGKRKGCSCTATERSDD